MPSKPASCWSPIPWHQGSLVFSFCIARVTILGVEMDIPWDSSQVDQFGGSFEAWKENQFRDVLLNVCKTLASNPFTIVIAILLYHVFFRCTILRLKVI